MSVGSVRTNWHDPAQPGCTRHSFGVCSKAVGACTTRVIQCTDLNTPFVHRLSYHVGHLEYSLYDSFCTSFVLSRGSFRVQSLRLLFYIVCLITWVIQSTVFTTPFPHPLSCQVGHSEYSLYDSFSTSFVLSSGSFRV